MAIYSRNAICTFIPKNACSVLRYNVALENQVVKDLNGRHWIHLNNQTFKPSLRDLVTANYTFVLLRCPFHRLVSCFLHHIVEAPETAMRTQYSDLARSLQLSGKLGRAFGSLHQWSLRQKRSKAEATTFADFVSFLEAPYALTLNVHWRPQTDFLVYQDYDDVFRLEDMPEMITTLQTKIGLTLRDTAALAGHGNLGRARIREGFFGRTDVLALRQLKQEKKVPEYERMYDADLYDRVARLYAKDIDLYSACFGTSALLQRP
jgi:hypothetical protein